MSIRSHAKEEMVRANVEPEAQVVIIGMLDLFLDYFDSGGAAHVGQELFNRCLAGKPLSPLTGEDSEWFDPTDEGHFFQNKRCGSVFKTNVGIPHKNILPGDCYDIDAPGPLKKITFPYDPESSRVPSPVMEVVEKDGHADI